VAGRTRGLGSVLLLAAVAGLASVFHTILLILIPLAALLVALGPHRGLWMGAGLAGAVLLLQGPTTDWLFTFSRGWSLLLAGWFVVACVLLQGPGFLHRGLLAVAGSAVSAAVFFGLNPGSFDQLDQRIRQVFDASVQAFLSTRSTPPPESALAIFEQAGEVQALMYPAVLALASLCALAVAWWAHRRIVAGEPQPLNRLREFRFTDGLIWVLIAGLILILAPLDAVADRAGSNLLVFMSALYALRGLAVVTVLADSLGPLMMGLAVVLSALVYPLAITVGVTDTWLDLRTRQRKPPPSGS
jgi:hypothetical protein